MWAEIMVCYRCGTWKGNWKAKSGAVQRPSGKLADWSEPSKSWPIRYSRKTLWDLVRFLLPQCVPFSLKWPSGTPKSVSSGHFLVLSKLSRVWFYPSPELIVRVRKERLTWKLCHLCFSMISVSSTFRKRLSCESQSEKMKEKWPLHTRGGHLTNVCMDC